jgi:hypothetical protein
LLKAIICFLQLNTQWFLGRHPTGGLLVIHAVGLQSMYYVVIVDGFRVARTRGTTRRTQRFERRGLNVGDLRSQRNTVTEASIVGRATHCREGDRALPRFRALVVR